MTYQMNYESDTIRQIRPEGDHAVNASISRPKTKRHFAIPSIIKTAGTFVVCGGIFFAAEAFSPDFMRPSTLLGTVEARVGAQVKAAELTQQAKYENWAADVKLRAEQRANAFNSASQAILAQFSGTMDRTKIYAQGIVELQNKYTAARIGQTQSEQGTDIALQNYVRLYGRVLNYLERGAGNGALGYAKELHNELSDELTDAAQNGELITVEGWNTGLPTVDDVKRQLDMLRPIDIPPPPRFGADVPESALR